MRAFVALGTNLGDRLKNLAEARRQLSRLGAHWPGPVLETDALLPAEDPTPQPKYLNTVDAVDTRLDVFDLFRALKRIERVMGRQTTTRWQPRIIDLDLIQYEDLQVATDELTVPHPRMHQRAFVMQPLKVLQLSLSLRSGERAG